MGFFALLEDIAFPSRNSESPNDFLDIHGQFFRRGLKLHPFPKGFITFLNVLFALSQKTVLPMVFLVFWWGLGAAQRAGAGRPKT